MAFRICLIGNPNSGKTTLFNALTGSRQRVGNFAGVTVECKEGKYKGNRDITIIDLPGHYSLYAVTEDERAVVKYLKTNPPDAIINVVDGTRLERSLLLTGELASLNIPIVIAVNMCDELSASGVTLDAKALSTITGVPVVKISAKKNINLKRLMTVVTTAAKIPSGELFSESDHRYYSSAEKLLKGVIAQKQTNAQKLTERLDKLLMHRVWGIPIFVCVIVLVYFLSFKLGGGAGKRIGEWFNWISREVKPALINAGAAEWAADLVANAVVRGVGTVISFLPQILVLFLLLAIIEESGYAARMVFNTDRIFRFFGLGGKSMLPMLLSCGCAVTGIMSTRIIESESERRATIFVSPFMPCGAKAAVFGWFSYEYFGGNALVAASLYFLGIACAAAGSKILTMFSRGHNGLFVLEIPTFRMPGIKDVLRVLINKTTDFLKRAGTVIFAVSVVLWLLMNVGRCGYAAGSAQNSFLYDIGGVLKYLFMPLGFGTPQAAVAVMSGFLAKEAVIETLAVCADNVGQVFESGYAAYSFMAFILLSPPCVSAIATAARELGGAKPTFYMLAFQTAFAYSVSLIINFIGILSQRFSHLLLSAGIGIIIFIAVVTAIIKSGRCNRKCAGCVAKKDCKK